MCINIIPQNGIIQVGLHCQLDDIDDFRGFAAEKRRAEDFVVFSINNSFQVTGNAAKQAGPRTGCFCNFGNFYLMAGQQCFFFAETDARECRVQKNGIGDRRPVSCCTVVFFGLKAAL